MQITSFFSPFFSKLERFYCTNRAQDHPIVSLGFFSRRIFARFNSRSWNAKSKHRRHIAWNRCTGNSWCARLKRTLSHERELNSNSEEKRERNCLHTLIYRNIVKEERKRAKKKRKGISQSLFQKSKTWKNISQKNEISSPNVRRLAANYRVGPIKNRRRSLWRRNERQ